MVPILSENNKYPDLGKASNRPYVLQLVGGLGNQLFGYFAGKYLELQTGVQVRFLLSRQSMDYPSGQSTILDLRPLSNIETRGSLATQAKGLTKRLGLYAEKIIKSTRSNHSSFFSIYKPEGIGFEPFPRELSPGDWIYGYFQCSYFVDHVLSQGHPSLEVKNPSPWFISMVKKAVQEQPVIVHIRRGDYVTNLQARRTLGVLDEQYYKNALSRITEQFRGREIWFFSDDKSAAKSLADFAGTMRSRVIEQPKTSNAAEALILMSKGCGFVLSNSTFSWWAAKLSESDTVIHPSDWYVARENPEGLLPEAWLSEGSVWME